MLKIQVVSYNDIPSSQTLSATFDELGGNIGRAEGNALVLNDPGRSISRIHAAVVYRGGQFYIRGLGSTMPVFLNDHPLNNGQDTVIANGDKIRIGDYVLQVISEEGAAGINLQSTASHQPQTQFLGATGNQSLADLLAFPEGGVKSAVPSSPNDVFNPTAQNITDPLLASQSTAVPNQMIPADFDPVAALSPAAEDKLPEVAPAASIQAEVMNPLFETKEKPLSIDDVIHPADPLTDLSKPPVQESVDPLIALNRCETAQAAQRDDSPALSTPLPSMHTQPEQTPAAPVQQMTGGGQPQSGHDELLQAFLKGAGLTNLEKPLELTPQLMQQLGQLLRMSTQGTLDLLLARALMKREMRAEATIMAARENNPLKLSPNVEVALLHLLTPKSKEHGFMPPLQAMKDAYNDLRSHQFGFMAGMRASLSGVLERFNPKRLEKRLEQKTLVDSVFSINRKAKLWDLFTDRFSDISSEAEEDFQVMFSKEFLKAYEAQIAKLELEDNNKQR